MSEASFGRRIESGPERAVEDTVEYPGDPCLVETINRLSPDATQDEVVDALSDFGASLTIGGVHAYCNCGTEYEVRLDGELKALKLDEYNCVEGRD